MDSLGRPHQSQRHADSSDGSESSEVGFQAEWKLCLKSNKTDKPLQFWAVNAKAMPRLPIVARHFLCTMVSSASSERVLSAAGQIVSDRRTRLDTKRVEKLVVLRSNRDVLSARITERML